MTKATFSRILLLACAVTMGLAAQAQQTTALTTHTTDTDVAITYVAERAKVASVNCGCFWLQGGSGDLAFTFYHGLGVAMNLTGVHASNIQSSGLELDTVMFGLGPRYTYRMEKPKFHTQRMAIFGEGLIAGIHGFNSVFPSSTGVKGAASSLAVQAGGGIDIGITKTIAIRAIEADYVRSSLPNNASGTQNNLRLAAGIAFHFGR